MKLFQRATNTTLTAALTCALTLSLAACYGDAGGDNAVNAAGSESSELAPTNDSERAMASYIEGMDEIVTSMKAVDDEASADEATETIGRVGEELSKQMETWASLGEDELAAARTRYEAELGRAKGEMMVALTNLMKDPGLATKIQQAVQDLPKFEE